MNADKKIPLFCSAGISSPIRAATRRDLRGLRKFSWRSNGIQLNRQVAMTPRKSGVEPRRSKTLGFSSWRLSVLAVQFALFLTLVAAHAALGPSAVVIFTFTGKMRLPCDVDAGGMFVSRTPPLVGGWGGEDWVTSTGHRFSDGLRLPRAKTHNRGSCRLASAQCASGLC
jgi:hypothetical protein